MVFSADRRPAPTPPAGPALVTEPQTFQKYEMSEEPVDNNKGPPRRLVVQREGITPYLGLGARLSQVWLNRWTILLLLIMLRVMLRIGDLNTELADAKVKALAACTKVEDIGSAMASMPHYLSVGVNSMVASGINDVVHGLVDVLSLIITGVEELILFVINWYIGTYACLIAAFIHGGLDVAISVVEDADKFINSEVGPLADGIQTGINGLNSAVSTLWAAESKATSAVASVASNVGGDITSAAGKATSVVGSILGGILVKRTDVPSLLDAVGDDGLVIRAPVPTPPPMLPAEALALYPRGGPPMIDLSGPLNALRSIHINDTQFVGDLVKLNTSIPTFAQAENLTEQALSIPFNFLKNKLNESLGGFSFDRSLFPVAQKEALTFCSDNSKLVQFFDVLFEAVVIAYRVIIAIGVLLAILAIIFWAIVDVRRYRSERKRARVFINKGYDGMDVVYIASRPFTSWIGFFFARRFKSPKAQTLVRWAVAYATSLPALFVLALALAGLVSVACQAIIEAALRKEVPILAAEVGDFAAEVVNKLENVSQRWANDTNGVILDMQNGINDDLLGMVVNATTAVNNTLNTIENEIHTVLTDVFNNTILYYTIMDVVRCLVDSKIEKVEAGLTWVHDNAHVTFPTLPNDLFSQGANDSITGDTHLTSFLSTPASVTTDDITAAVDHVLNALHSGIVQEFLISIALLLIYVIVVLSGICYTAFQAFGHVDGNAQFVSGHELQKADAQAMNWMEDPFADSDEKRPVLEGSSFTGDKKAGYVARGAGGSIGRVRGERGGFEG